MPRQDPHRDDKISAFIRLADGVREAFVQIKVELEQHKKDINRATEARVRANQERWASVDLKLPLRTDPFHPRRNNRRRKPPEAGLSVPAIPPRGPLPKQGGAAAPLDFETD